MTGFLTEYNYKKIVLNDKLFYKFNNFDIEKNYICLKLIRSLIYYSLFPACPHRYVLLEDSKMKHNLISSEKGILTLRYKPFDTGLLKDIENWTAHKTRLWLYLWMSPCLSLISRATIAFSNMEYIIVLEKVIHLLDLFTCIL